MFCCSAAYILTNGLFDFQKANFVIQNFHFGCKYISVIKCSFFYLSLDPLHAHMCLNATSSLIYSVLLGMHETVQEMLVPTGRLKAQQPLSSIHWNACIKNRAQCKPNLCFPVPLSKAVCVCETVKKVGHSSCSAELACVQQKPSVTLCLSHSHMHCTRTNTSLCLINASS